MRISKSASGKEVVNLTKTDWESFGKKAGWLNEDGKLIVQASEIEKEAEIDRIAQPVEAPPRPAAPPKETPTESPTRRRRRQPNPGVRPAPKGRKPAPKEDLDEIAASADNVPTIASELKRMRK
jgi:hypothetical protein